MAKSVLKLEAAAYGTYGALGEAAAGPLAEDLARFADAPPPERGFRSFVAAFGGEPPASEAAFERALWALLRALHARDRCAWDAAVSPDPESPHFSFSFAGTAFYVVGMHPRASRPARRLPVPAVVFNLHAQFEQLRREGRYDKVRSLIRERDRAYAGSVNPMMEDHGVRSEARQYAGRAVEAGWACPFTASGGAASGGAPEPTAAQDATPTPAAPEASGTRARCPHST